MRKLLNTIYVTNEQMYLMLDGENLVCKAEGEIKLRIPFENVENIVCFSYLGCSPALMGKCVEKLIPINFMSPQGKFLAKVCGETKGNVFLRVEQIDCFRACGLQLAQNTMAAKFSNTRQVIRRTLHDNAELRDNQEIQKVLGILHDGIENVYRAETIEEVMGIEGYCHALRSGRVSLACDMVEEIRCIVERFVITLLNLQIIGEKDFEKQISGAVWLNADGRKKVLSKWQEKKRTDLMHPYLKQKIPFGLLPYVQSNLLAKYIRGDIESYPPYLQK